MCVYYSAHMIRVIAMGGPASNNDVRGATKAALRKSGKMYEVANRADAAHANLGEGLPIYIAGVLACVFTGVSPELVDKCVANYLATAVAFVVVYCAQPLAGSLSEGFGAIRSVLWLTRTTVACSMIMLAAQAAKTQ